MSFEKENFLRTRLVKYLQQLDPTTSPKWGKMSVQQMIEHMAVDAVRTANGRLIIPQATSPERMAALREFLMTDKPFRENTKNPLLGEEPRAPYFHTVQAAISTLQQELIYFFEAFAENPQLITHNPLFGDLNFEQNVQLLYKHAIHHLRQFGVEPLNV
jgi:hypothetical protein